MRPGLLEETVRGGPGSISHLRLKISARLFGGAGCLRRDRPRPYRRIPAARRSDIVNVLDRLLTRENLRIIPLVNVAMRPGTFFIQLQPTCARILRNYAARGVGFARSLSHVISSV